MSEIAAFLEKTATEVVNGFWAGLDFILTGTSDGLDAILDRLW